MKHLKTDNIKNNFGMKATVISKTFHELKHYLRI